MKIDNFKKWAADKSKFVAVSCHSFAMMPDFAHKALLLARDDQKLNKRLPQPPIDIWLKFYKAHKEITSTFLTFLSDPTGFNDSLSIVFDNPESLLGDDDNCSLEVFEANLDDHFIKKHESNFYDAYISFYEAPQELFDEHNPEERMVEKLADPIVYFIFKTYIPCWLYYGKFPIQFLREARQGNLDSLEKILRIDSSVAMDLRISKIIHNLRTTNPLKYEAIISAQLKHPQKPLLPLLKTSLAAMIAVISEAFGKRLNEPEIRELFDAVSRDYGIDDIDTDLPESPEAFKKAIQRKMPVWK